MINTKFNIDSIAGIIEQKKVCIIVLGMHRSGTSCLMGSLEKYGLYSGAISTRSPYNKKGNREHKNIVALNDKVLKLNKACWHNPSNSTEWDDELRRERDEIIKSFLNTKEIFFGFKDPRTLFTLAFWEEGFSTENIILKYVGTFRNPSAVMSSFKNRNNNIDEDKVLLLWKRYNKILLEQYNNKQFPIISYDMDEKKYLNNIKRIAINLGLDIKQKEKDNFYDISLKNNENVPIDLIADKDAKLIYNDLRKIIYNL